jgi:transposase
MRKIREALRLKFDCGLTNRKIALSCDVSRTTIGEYLRRFKAAGLRWPIDDSLDDEQLERLLFPAPTVPSHVDRPVPDWPYIHAQLRRKSVTMMLLWQEYKSQYPDGYQYSQFCHRYRQWSGKLNPVLRQHHRAGEMLFVDYAGQTVSVFDRQAGKLRCAQIFVATLGASNYTYAEATWTQQLPDWIGSHCRAFAFFGGVPQMVVPDNLKSGVKQACLYEPELNPTYRDMAAHYDTAVVPTRVRKPRDKAKVESAVLLVERWILAALRDRSFFSLAELNDAIAKLLKKLNSRPFQKLPGSRQSMFEKIDKPALKPLPVQPYAFAEWKKARVNIDYHIEVERHYYSVPYRLIKKQIDVRITANIVEGFYKNKRVCSHRRSFLIGRHTTVKEHMPKAHQKWVDWTPDRIIRWAESIGPNTGKLIERVLDSRRYPQQGFRSCLGILRLAKSYGEKRLEAAAERALIIGAKSYTSVASILKHGLDQKPPTPVHGGAEIKIDHDNIRGSRYYH